MPKHFVFAEEILDLIRAGRRSIELPAGAVVTSAAWDVIKDHRVEVSFQAEAEKSGPAEPVKPEAEAEVETESKEMAAVAQAVASAAAELSEEEIEAVVTRVLAKFREVKDTVGVGPGPAAGPEDGDDLIICRCEEITRGEIKAAIRNGLQTLNGIKRVTRAGMGLCQGQTCGRLVAQLLAAELGVSPAEIEPTTARAPVRPVRLSVFAAS